MFRNQQLSNLEVSNLQEISRRLHMADEKQFGKYDGGILKDPSIVNTCTEQELYRMIEAFGYKIWRLNHDMADGRIKENIDLMPYQYAIEYCVMHTTRFGVEISEPKEGEQVKATKSYWAWFKWWDNYFKNTLTDEECEEYEHKSERGEDISKFRPTGDWKDNL